ncbi:zf-CCHC domain-containing protein [Tanacetum coccineum]
MDFKNYKEGHSMYRPTLFEANSFIYWKNRFETYVKYKDIDLWHIIVDGDYKPTVRNTSTGRDESVPYERQNEEYDMAVRDFKKFFRRGGRFVRQPHDDKKAFQKVKEDKKGKSDRKCFRCGDPNHFISDCPKHSQSDQKVFFGGSWSDSEEDEELNKDKICLMAHESNKVHFNSLYYSSSSLDDETLQTEYNKL